MKQTKAGVSIGQEEAHLVAHNLEARASLIRAGAYGDCGTAQVLRAIAGALRSGAAVRVSGAHAPVLPLLKGE